MQHKTFTEGLELLDGPAFTAALLPRPSSGVVSVVGAIHAGTWHAEASKEPVADVAASLLDEGTKHRSREIFRTSLENKGVTVSFWANGRYLFFSVLSTKTALPEALELAFEALREPLLSKESCTEVIAREAAERIHVSENTGGEAGSALTRLIYAPDSAGYQHPALVERGILLSLKRDDVLSFVEQNYRGRIVVSVVGDIEPSALEKLLSRYTKDWNAAPGASGRSPHTLEVPKIPRESYVSIPGKESVDIYMGASLPMPSSDPSFIPLRLAVDLLGGGFSDHLAQTVRDRDGLTYGTYARISGRENGNGMRWYIWAMFGNSLFEKGKAALKKELEVFVSSGITETRLKEKAAEINGRLSVLFSSHKSAAWEILAGMLASGRADAADMYAKRALEISFEEVSAAAKKYLRIDAIAAAGSITEKGKLL